VETIAPTLVTLYLQVPDYDEHFKKQIKDYKRPRQKALQETRFKFIYKKTNNSSAAAGVGI